MKKLIATLSAVLSIMLVLAACGSSVTTEEIKEHLESEFDKKGSEWNVMATDSEVGSFEGIDKESFVSGRTYMISNSVGVYVIKYVEVKNEKAAKEYAELKKESYDKIYNLGKIVILASGEMDEILKPLTEK